MYPTTARMIIVVHETGLTKSQVGNWFQYQREKIEKEGGELLSYNCLDEETLATSGVRALKMWRNYKKDPEGYYQELLEEVKGIANED